MSNEKKPPNTNRGVENTDSNNKEKTELDLITSVDWFSCTFLVENEPTEVIKILGLDPYEFRSMRRGVNGYKKGLIFQHIKVLYDGSENMGVHVEMSGQACRTFEESSDLEWGELFLRFLTHYVAMVNVTRFDIAVDDFKGYFKIPDLVEEVKNGNVTSQFRIARRISNFLIKTGEEIGHTLYFGQPSSSVQIRFYEKNIEQEMKGNVVPKKAEIWNRTEIQARDERAMMIMKVAAENPEGLGGIVQGILSNYVNFRVPYTRNGKETKDKNKSRWDIADFWIKFLGNVEPLKLTMRPSQITIERKYKWIDHQVKKTIAMLSLAFPNDTDALIQHLLVSGFEEMDEDDWKIIKRFEKRELNFEEYLEEIKKAHLDK